MSATDRNAEILNRRQTMLRSVCSGAVRGAPEAGDVTETLANADGLNWIERAGFFASRHMRRISLPLAAPAKPAKHRQELAGKIAGLSLPFTLARTSVMET